MKAVLAQPSLWLGIFAVSLDVAAAWFGLPLIEGNDDVESVIVTVFSILSGFLIAVMTLLGDQSILPGSWKIAQNQSSVITGKLVRQKWLFYVYLFTLALIFLKSLVGKQWPDVVPWLQRAYMGAAVTGFILSFRLPASLMQVQVERVNAVIAARRNKASTLDRN